VETFEHLGQALSLLRNLRRMSGQELADKSKLSGSRISLYENNQRLPELPSLAKYLEGLDATLFDLVLALDSVQRSAKYLRRAEAAERLDEDGDLLVLWPGKGGMLAPRTLSSLCDQMMGQVWRFHQQVREVVLGQAARSRAKDTRPPSSDASPTEGEPR
jgi:transcriptional regulator with XRE-family HTH domain